jgi:hypothetical protein
MFDVLIIGGVSGISCSFGSAKANRSPLVKKLESSRIKSLTQEAFNNAYGIAAEL